MATTTNFGWTTPDDTALVKDGASAIRTLGSGIDTSLVDLKGGTTGQVLSKATNTDLDFTWVSRDESFKGVSCKLNSTVGVGSGGGGSAIPFDGEDYDTDAFHSTSTNNERITVPTGLGGKYQFNITAIVADATVGYMRLALRKNGTTTYYVASDSISSPGYDSYLNGSYTLSLVAGDYVELMFFHNRGSSLDLKIDTRFQADFLGA